MHKLYTTITVALLAAGLLGIAGITALPSVEAGTPFGEGNSENAQNEGGMGGAIQDFCSQGTCGGNGQHLGDFRASDEANKEPGKAGDTVDETAGNPDN